MKIWVILSIILVVIGVSFIAVSATANSPDFIKSGISFGSLATANILNNQGLHKESIGFGERALELYPEDYNAVKEISRAYIGLEDYDNAVAGYEEYIEEMGGNVEHQVWYDKAEIHKAAGDYEKASECYNAVIDDCNAALVYSPYDTGILYELGTMNMKIGSYEEARVTYDKIIQASPEDAQAWLGKGDAYLLMSAGNQEELNMMYKSLIGGEAYSGEAVPDNSGVYDAYEKAHEAYMKAIELDPRLYPAVVSRFMGHYEHSVELYSDIVNI